MPPLNNDGVDILRDEMDRMAQRAFRPTFTQDEWVLENPEYQVEQVETKEMVDTGAIIRSKRKFGIEIEFNAPQKVVRKIRESQSGFRVDYDGSVDMGGEIITNVLSGKKGEDTIVSIGSLLQKNKTGHDESCALHVHLDAKDYIGERTHSLMTLAEALNTKSNSIMVFQPGLPVPDNGGSWVLDEGAKALNPDKNPILTAYIGNKIVYFVSKDGPRGIQLPKCGNGIGRIDKKGNIVEPDKTCVVGGSVYLSKSALNYPAIVTTSSKKNKDVLYRLRRLAAFYHAFDDVMMSFLPGHRRENDYAIRFNTLMSLKSLQNCETLQKFFGNLYNEHDQRNLSRALQQQRHASRFYGINLTSLFKHGTIENRQHQSTNDSEEILRWVELNQAIVDGCADLNNHRFKVIRSIKGSLITDLHFKTDLFFKKLSLAPETEAYYRGKVRQYAGDGAYYAHHLLNIELN